MVRAADFPYGAFELKRHYQRNMIIGTLSTVLLAAVMISWVWVYGSKMKGPVIPPDEGRIGIYDTIIFIPERDPMVDPDELPGGGGAIPPPPLPEFNDGPIVIIEEGSGEKETVFSDPDDRPSYGPSDPKQTDDPGGFIGADGPYSGVTRIPGPETFIPYEEEPVIIDEEVPRYPPIALAAGFTAWVRIQAFVDQSGNVLKAVSVNTNRPGIGFEEAAIKAALKCKYRPAIQNGNPVGIWITYKVVFKL
jgi:protein TonB